MMQRTEDGQITLHMCFNTVRRDRQESHGLVVSWFMCASTLVARTCGDRRDHFMVHMCFNTGRQERQGLQGSFYGSYVLQHWSPGEVGTAGIILWFICASTLVARRGRDCRDHFMVHTVCASTLVARRGGDCRDHFMVHMCVQGSQWVVLCSICASTLSARTDRGRRGIFQVSYVLQHCLLGQIGVAGGYFRFLMCFNTVCSDRQGSQGDISGFICASTLSARTGRVVASVADPDPYDTDMDPDHAFHFDTNPDHAFQFYTAPDPYRFREEMNLKQYFLYIFA